MPYKTIRSQIRMDMEIDRLQARVQALEERLDRATAPKSELAIELDRRCKEIIDVLFKDLGRGRPWKMGLDQ